MSNTVYELTDLAVFVDKSVLLLSLLGVFMNGFVFWALTKTKNWFSASNVLFINLFLADTFLCMWIALLSSTHVFGATEWYFKDWCQISGFVSQGLAGVSYFTVLFQTLNPFIVIVLGWNSLTGKQMSMLVAGIWLSVGIFFPSMPFIGGDSYVPQTSLIWCHYNYTSDSIWTRIVIALTFSLVAVSPFLMFGAYTMMWIKMRRQNAQTTKSTRTEWQIVRAGAYFIVSTLVFWILPFRTMLLQFLNHGMGSEVDDILFLVLGTAPNAFNSLIFVAVNSQVRQTIFRIFDPDYVAVSTDEINQGDVFMIASARASVKSKP